MRLFVLLSLSIIGCATNKAQPIVGKTKTVIQKPLDNKIDSVALLLIEQSVNSEELKQYYHFELEERYPLILVLNTGSSLPSQSITYFDHQLDLHSHRTGINETRALELLRIDKTFSEATLIFKYSIEGITVQVDFRMIGEKWNRKAINITEN
jgi:hypothetical protein